MFLDAGIEIIPTAKLSLVIADMDRFSENINRSPCTVVTRGPASDKNHFLTDTYLKLKSVRQ